MANLIFDLSPLPSLLDAARRCEAPIVDLGDSAPGLLLVSNHAGVYLLANAQLPDEHDARLCVLHARGFNPETDANWQRNRQQALGEQDLVEFIPVSAFDDVFEHNSSELVLSLTDEEVMVCSRVPS